MNMRHLAINFIIFLLIVLSGCTSKSQENPVDCLQDKTLPLALIVKEFSSALQKVPAPSPEQLLNGFSKENLQNFDENTYIEEINSTFTIYKTTSNSSKLFCFNYEVAIEDLKNIYKKNNSPTLRKKNKKITSYLEIKYVELIESNNILHIIARYDCGVQCGKSILLVLSVKDNRWVKDEVVIISQV